MAETQFLEILPTGWTNVSAVAGPNARVTNIGEHMLIWRKSVSEPPADNNDGHRVRDDNPFDYVVKGDESIWMRTVNYKTFIAYTPDLAVGVFRGSLDVHDADPHRNVYNQYLHFDTATTTNPATAISAGANVIDFVSVAGFAVGNSIKIENGNVEPTFSQIVDITGNLVTLDIPTVWDHPTTATITLIVINLADATITAGASPTTPAIATSHIPIDQVVHVTNMSIVMTDDAAMDFTKFGGIPALTNGCVLRAQTDGLIANFTNWKTNGDLDSDAFPVRYQTKSGGGGYGLSAIYNIKESVEAIVYLNGAIGDRFEYLVQDPLGALSSLSIKLQGHYEGI